MEEQATFRILICCWWEYKTPQHFGKTVWQFLTKLNILSHDLAIPLLGVNQKKMILGCTSMLGLEC